MLLTVTSSFIVLSALALSEVSNWRVLAHDHSACVISAIKAIECSLCLFLSHELDINISDHVVTDVVGHNYLF